MMPDHLARRSLFEADIGFLSPHESTTAYLLVRVHRCKASLMAGLASLLSDAGNPLLRAMGEVAGVGVVSHDS